MKISTRSEIEDATQFARELDEVIRKHNPKTRAFVVCLDEGEQVSFVADKCKLQTANLLAQILRNQIAEFVPHCCENSQGDDDQDDACDHHSAKVSLQ